MLPISTFRATLAMNCWVLGDEGLHAAGRCNPRRCSCSVPSDRFPRRGVEEIVGVRLCGDPLPASGFRVERDVKAATPAAASSSCKEKLMSRIAKAAAVVAGTGAILVGGAGMAAADAGALGTAAGSPGVLSGNAAQVPVHVPANLCGNTVDVVGLLNPVFGNGCTISDGA
jgi:hypothetical protein